VALDEGSPAARARDESDSMAAARAVLWNFMWGFLSKEVTSVVEDAGRIPEFRPLVHAAWRIARIGKIAPP
jgi:hypothetical protein